MTLPVIGLILFSAVTLQSVRFNATFRSGYRYFMVGCSTSGQDAWKSGDTPTPLPCEDRSLENCVAWEPEYIWIDPGIGQRVLIITALPAFALGAEIVSALSRLGVEQVVSFFAAMPILVLLWFLGRDS